MGVVRASPGSSVTLRGLQPGDLGLVIMLQARFYAEHHGYDWSYEGLVARILADYQQDHDANRDNAWIAEIDGRTKGFVFLMHGDAPGLAKLRLLYVENDARGAGLGKLLVQTCIEQARALNYDTLELWTDGALVAATSLYERFGFILSKQTSENMFGTRSTGQVWRLDLGI